MAPSRRLQSNRVAGKRRGTRRRPAESASGSKHICVMFAVKKKQEKTCNGAETQDLFFFSKRREAMRFSDDAAAASAAGGRRGAGSAHLLQKTCKCVKYFSDAKSACKKREATNEATFLS